VNWLEMERDPSDERTGVFTSGTVSIASGLKIALYFTGRKHAGEKLADAVKQRAPDLNAPIQMCDGLSRNTPKLSPGMGDPSGHLSGAWKTAVRDPVFLPIPESLKMTLDALPLPRNAEQDCPYYFWNRQTSRRQVVGIAERMLSAVFKKSGVKDAHAHRYRHTLASAC